MTDNQPTILNYATPPQINRYARWPTYRILFLAIVIPGLSSSLIRNSAWRCIVLSGSIPLSFAFFGPIWGEYLFKGTRWTEAGLYPFLASIAATEAASILLAIRDRRRVLLELGDIRPADQNFPHG